MFAWGNNRRFYSYADFFRKCFGNRVQKLTLDAGFSCPNRDGTIGTGGCTFCNNNAFNPSYCTPKKSISQQLSEGIEFHRERYRSASAYLAYFQAYSNTHASLNILKERYEEALAYPDVVGLVIGTRPDCINNEILDYLQKLAICHFIQVEYGVESTNNEILLKVNRGHSYEQSVSAIEQTAQRDIHTGAHFIIGFPGDSEESILKAIKQISKLPLSSVKFHQLQIFKDTRMEQEYIADMDSFLQYGLDEYLELMVKVVELLNPDFVLERIASEVPPRFLVSPAWENVRMYDIIRRFENKLEKKNTWQGRLFSA